MPLPFSLLVLFVGSAALGIVVAGLAWNERPAVGATSLAAVGVGASLWVVGYAFELAAPTLGVALFWAKVQWFAAPFVPVAWFVFTVEYAGLEDHVDRWMLLAVLAIPLATLVFAWTNPADLMRESVTGVHQDGLFVLQQERGPWFWLDLGYSYALILVGTVVLLHRFAESLTLYGEHLVAFSLAAAAPVVASVVSVPLFHLGLVVDVTPFAFLVSQTVCLFVLTRNRLLSARPVPPGLARESVVQNLSDGVVVVDTTGRVVDLNESAAAMLDVDVGTARGRAAAEVIPNWTRIRDDGDAEAVLTPTASTRYFDFNGTTLTDSRGGKVGHAVVIRDVTERVVHLQGLDVLDRILRHNLRNEMNVVYGHAELVEEVLSQPVPDLDRATSLAASIQRRALDTVDLTEKARDAHEIFEAYGTDHTLVDPADAIHDAVADVRSSFPDADIEVASLPGRAVVVDPVLELVVRNLAENGVEHNPADHPSVVVRAAVTDGTVRVEVLDDGPGISEWELEALSAGEETPLRHGSGIGLWLVTWALRLVGGTIDIAARESGGTRVTVSVPCVDHDGHVTE